MKIVKDIDFSSWGPSEKHKKMTKFVIKISYKQVNHNRKT